MIINEQVQKLIAMSLREDVGNGDHSSLSCISKDEMGEMKLLVKEDGILCGVDVAREVIRQVDEKIEMDLYMHDGDPIKKGDIVFKLTGPACSMLTAERNILNFMQRMSGIATQTNKYAKEIEDLHTKVIDTRKTTPNFRMFEKYSVKVGGGKMHRFNLSDCVMIKDNHIASVGSITNAVNKIRENSSHAHKIEVECDTKEQVIEALTCGVDIIMLDNMTTEQMQEAIAWIDHRAETECSGNVTKENIARLTALGVDYISSGALTHSSPIMDISMKNLHAI